MPPDLGKALLKLSEKQLLRIGHLLQGETPSKDSSTERNKSEKSTKAFGELSPYRQVHRTWYSEGPAQAIGFARKKFVSKGMLKEETSVVGSMVGSKDVRNDANARWKRSN